MKKQLGLLIKFERVNQSMSQSKLAKDVCSVSYLSKIENLETEANSDILRKLVSNLGHTLQDKPSIISNFKKESIQFWNRYFEFDTNHIVGNEVSSFGFEDGSLLFSECGIDFLLLSMFKKTFIEHLKLEEVEALRDYQDHFTDRQQYQLDIITLHIKMKNHINLSNYDLKLKDPYGNADYLIAHALFDQRNYEKAKHFASKSYETLANKGNVMGMLHTTLLLADCYYHLGELNKHLEESSKILRINRFIKNSKFDKAAYLNIGSSYLINNNFDLAIKYLNVALGVQIRHSNLDNAILEKLAFAYALSGEVNHSIEVVKQLELLETNEIIIEVIKEISSNSSFIQSKTYQKNLESIFNELGQDETSRKNFFGGLLYLVYKKTYNYNKALKLLEYFRKFEFIPFNA